MTSINTDPLTVILKPGREHPLRRFHPWVFSGAVEQSDSRIEEGDIVEVYSSEKQFLGIGYWNAGGIAIKILSFKKKAIDKDFWKDVFTQSRKLRADLGLIDSKLTNAFRICNGEGDGVPGLIIDLYHTTAVMQFHSFALMRRQQEILDSLQEVYADKISNIVVKITDTLQEAKAKLPEFKSGVVCGENVNREILESEMRFLVDYEEGQKTGFFLDQRDNRNLVKELAHGREVLNAFCYTGGFSIAALLGGAKRVVSIDSSRTAIATLQENLEINSCLEKHESFSQDYFDFIRDCKSSFDLIILDPPAFTKHRESIDAAVKGYANVNHQTMLRLKPGALMLTFSCSQLVSRQAFRDAVSEAAYRAGKQMKIIKELHAAACHPTSLFHPEGQYLKGLLLKVI